MRADAGRAAPIGGHPAITVPQKAHHSGNARNPFERPCPPDFSGQRHGGICAAGHLPHRPAIGNDKAHLPQQFASAQPQQDSHTRILQRSNVQSAPPQNGRQKARHAHAERAIRVIEKPSPRPPPLAFDEFRCQRNHLSPPSSSLHQTAKPPSPAASPPLSRLPPASA